MTKDAFRLITVLIIAIAVIIGFVRQANGEIQAPIMPLVFESDDGTFVQKEIKRGLRCIEMKYG